MRLLFVGGDSHFKAHLHRQRIDLRLPPVFEFAAALRSVPSADAALL